MKCSVCHESINDSDDLNDLVIYYLTFHTFEKSKSVLLCEKCSKTICKTLKIEYHISLDF